MNIKRFFSKSSREALSMVRQQLGADAVILSNRAVDGGTEILAVHENEMGGLISNAPMQPTAPALPIPSLAAPKPEMARPPARLISTTDDEDEPLSLLQLLTSRNRVLTGDSEQPAPAARPAARPAAVGTDLDSMMHEIKSMRQVLQSQLSELSWASMQQRSPARADVLNRLLAAGFSAGLARQIAEKMPAGHDAEQGLEWAKAVLAQNLHTIHDESEILDRGGVFALIGPTGVGKTTTTAKLAARYVMKHGSNSLGLITTDAYRIGGHEQLRIYGKILGVMVHAVKDQADLKIALNELKNKHTILIDTVGVSQRDRMVAEQTALLHSAGTDIRKLLCLNATCTGETLTDVISAYRGRGQGQGQAQAGLAGAIVTKLDEAATIGSALDILIREKLKLYYMANGQRVPEDLHVGNKQFLLRQAFKLGRQRHDSYALRNEELPALLAHAAPMERSLLVQEARHA